MRVHSWTVINTFVLVKDSCLSSLGVWLLYFDRFFGKLHSVSHKDHKCLSSIPSTSSAVAKRDGVALTLVTQYQLRTT